MAPPVKNCRTLLEQSFTAHTPLLTPTSTSGLGRRWQNSHQQYYLHHLHTILGKYSYPVLSNLNEHSYFQHTTKTDFHAQPRNGCDRWLPVKSVEPLLDVILTEISERSTITATTCCWILKTCCINYCDDWMLTAGHVCRSWQCSACTQSQYSWLLAVTCQHITWLWRQ